MCEKVIYFHQTPISRQDLEALLGNKTSILPRASTVSRATVESFVEHFCQWAAKRGLEIADSEAREWIENKLWCADTTITEEV